MTPSIRAALRSNARDGSLTDNPAMRMLQPLADPRWPGGRTWRLAATLLALAAAALMGGCAQTGYYWQSISGHLELMRAARPVPDWLGDPATPPAVRERLTLAMRLREFASAELGLPDNPSYRRYADLGRSAVVWNVVAAPVFSLRAEASCFPLLGCVTYRGYFDLAAARAHAAELRQRGLETHVYGVPAYSTLGWLNWAGGDPLLNTFIHYSEADLARLLFHELAHQVVYARDDTVFNESFATAVERVGAARWLERHGSDAVRTADATAQSRRAAFRALTLETRQRLLQVYASAGVGAKAADPDALRRDKAAAMQRFRDDYAQLRASWGGFDGYDAWVAQANNASFAALAAYEQLVPHFEALLARNGNRWPAFYDEVRRLADLPAGERRKQLGAAHDDNGD